MKTNKYEREFFTLTVNGSKNITDVAKNLGLKPYCGNRTTIKNYIKKYNIDVSHFIIVYDGNGKNFQGKKLSSILVDDSIFSTTNLKERLYKEGLKERKCELCGQGEIWLDKKISLILDHINGKNTDHRFENLRIVCPNCDAALPTFSGRNVKHEKKIKIDNKKHYDNNHCDCGKGIKNNSKRCINCRSIEQRKTERPTIEVLKNDIKELGYSGTGRKYGVSDNTIRKWLK